MGSNESRTDWISPAIIIILGLIGVSFIYSATLTSGGGYWLRQLVWMALGAGVYIFTSRLDYKFYLENAIWFYLGAVILLMLIYAGRRDPLVELHYHAVSTLRSSESRHPHHGREHPRPQRARNDRRVPLRLG